MAISLTITISPAFFENNQERRFLCSLAARRLASNAFLFLFIEGFSYARRSRNSLNKPLLDILFFSTLKAFSMSLSKTFTSKCVTHLFSFLGFLVFGGKTIFIGIL